MFQYIKPSTTINRKKLRGQHFATRKEIAQINNNIDSIKKVTEFYSENMSNGRIDYVFSTQNNINILPVQFGLDNFTHLTGISFAGSSATQQFNMLQKGFNTKPMLVKNDRSTFDKLNALPNISTLLDVNNFKVMDIRESRAMKNIKGTMGLIPNNEKALLALQNFEPTYYQPKSLLSLEKERQLNKFKNIPRNTVLGIFREKDDGKEIQMNYISLNQEALSNVSTLLGMITIMSKYAKQQGRQQTIDLTKSDKSKEAAAITKRRAYEAELRKRAGLNR